MGKSKMLNDAMVVCLSTELHIGTLGVCSHYTAQTKQMLRGGRKSKPSSFTTLPLLHAPQDEEENVKEERCTTQLL